MSDKRIRTRIKRLSLVSRNMKTIAGIRRRAIHRMEKQLGRKLEFNELNAVIRAVRVDYSHTPGLTQIPLSKITNEAIWADILSVGTKMSDHTEWVRIMRELPRVNSDPFPFNSNMSDYQFLLWLHTRLVTAHHENANYDYMLRLLEVIRKTSLVGQKTSGGASLFGADMSDYQFLLWLHARLVTVHREDANCDYMLRLSTVARKTLSTKTTD